MDVFYRSLESSLLALGLALVVAAFAASTLPRPATLAAGPSVTLPMLSVTATR